MQVIDPIVYGLQAHTHKTQLTRTYVLLTTWRGAALTRNYVFGGFTYVFGGVIYVFRPNS